MTQFDADKIKTIFSEVMGIPEQDIMDTLAYNSCVQWDSLKHLQLVAMFEETYNIELDMDDIIAMENYGKIKEILQKYLQ